MLRADVLILGAGPAGATAALNLAATHRVLMVDRARAAAPASHIGESLPPAAGRLMRDMGLLDDFLSQGHAPYHGNRALWNGVSTEYHFLRDPDGHGWHLERGRFDAWLRDLARQRGAALLTPASLQGIDADAGGWRVRLDTAGGACMVHAKIVIDASGRGASLARKLGARRERRDQLVSSWLYGGAEQADGGFSHIEGSEQGWWYSAPLPGRRRVLAFHTDADLAPARDLRAAPRLLAAALELPGIGGVLAQSGFCAETEVRVAAAHSAALDAAAGPGWFAAGDAAISFDPISSQGIFNAMYTGLAAAEAIARTLGGDANAYTDYTAELANIKTAYERHLAYSYGQEGRWPQAPFWRRRNATAELRGR